MWETITKKSTTGQRQGSPSLFLTTISKPALGLPFNEQFPIYRIPENKRTSERTKENQRENKEQKEKILSVKALKMRHLFYLLRNF